MVVTQTLTLQYYVLLEWLEQKTKVIHLNSLNPGRCGSNYTPTNDIQAGNTGFTLSVGLSVDQILSALYLPQYLTDPFQIYTSYQPTSEGLSPVKLFLNSKIWIIAELFTQLIEAEWRIYALVI